VTAAAIVAATVAVAAAALAWRIVTAVLIEVDDDGDALDAVLFDDYSYGVDADTWPNGPQS